MDFLDFLNGLERTLNQIEIKGKQNMDYMLGCFVNIDKARESYINLIKSKNQPIEDGEKDGRQTDIGTDSSDSNK